MIRPILKKGKEIASAVLVGGSLLLTGLEAEAQQIYSIPSGATNFDAGPTEINSHIDLLRTPEYRVRATSTSNGSLEGKTNDWILKGSNVFIKAIPNDNSYFDRWEGAPSGKEKQNPLLYSSDVPRDITAYFQTISPSNYLVRTLIEGNGTISPMNPSLPENGSTLFVASAVQPLHRIARIEQDGRVVYSNDGKLNDNSLTQTNFSYISNKGGLVKIVFEPKRIFLGGDFDGDGLADPVVHTEKGELKAFLSSRGYGKLEYDFQTRGNYPAIGDIDGDGMADLAYLDDFGKWKVQLSGDNYQMIDSYNSGIKGTPLVGDFDRDCGFRNK